MVSNPHAHTASEFCDVATWTCTAPSHHSVHVVRPFRSRVRSARRRIRPVWLPSTGASSVRSVERARWGLRNLCFARQADTERRRARRHASAQVHVWRGISVSQEVQAILPASAMRTHRPDLSSHPLQARPKRPAVSGVCCLPLCPLAPPICDTVRRALHDCCAASGTYNPQRGGVNHQACQLCAAGQDSLNGSAYCTICAVHYYREHAR